MFHLIVHWPISCHTATCRSIENLRCTCSSIMHPEWRSADRKTAQKSSSPNINPSRKETRKSVENSNGPESGRCKQKPFTVNPESFVLTRLWENPWWLVGIFSETRTVKLPGVVCQKTYLTYILESLQLQLVLFLILADWKRKRNSE